MLIDWFTVAAQLVNFFILVYLLKRFLYNPIVQHMNEREDKIKNRLKDASDKTVQAEQKIEEYRNKERELEEQSEEKLSQADRAAQKRKKEMLDQARDEVENKRRDWFKSLQNDRDNFSRELKKRTGREVIEVARRAIQDLADAALEDQLADSLLDRLKNLDENATKKLVKACNGKITVLSTFELDASCKRKITAALHGICSKQAEVVYQADRDFPLGIEISAGSVKLSWGIAGYLDELQTRVMNLIEEQTRQLVDKPEKMASHADNGNPAEESEQEEQNG
jgi:F-type H+-transporting ATPase subunit b